MQLIACGGDGTGVPQSNGHTQEVRFTRFQQFNHRLALFGARNGYGARERIGYEQVEADAFFFGSFHECLVERFRQTDSEFAAEFHVLVIGANR
jgi:hypothetical protein